MSLNEKTIVKKSLQSQIRKVKTTFTNIFGTWNKCKHFVRDVGTRVKEG